jgi:hypothetical protein
VGRDVLLKYDEQDIGRLYAYCDGEFIGEMLCHEVLGISRQESANAAKAKQKKLVVAQAKELRENKKAIKKNMVQMVLDYRVEQSSNISTLPKRSEGYSSEGLVEAGKADGLLKGRDAIWQTIRVLKTFTLVDIEFYSSDDKQMEDINRKTARTYVQGLEKPVF